jgi:uncharacterized membrane protein
MHVVLLILHMLATAVWLGGSVALVFVAIPAVRTVEGTARLTALRTLGRRWRPIGWGSMAVLVASGLGLAAGEGAFDTDMLVQTSGGRLLLAKCILVLVLIVASAVHDFVLGPRLTREIVEGRPERSRRPLVRVGWVGFFLSVLVPILGIVLVELL